LEGFSKGGYCPQVVQQHEARVADVVQDRNADIEGRHTVVALVD
jgi:hypothetical protein